MERVQEDAPAMAPLVRVEGRMGEGGPVEHGGKVEWRPMAGGGEEGQVVVGGGRDLGGVQAAAPQVP